MRTRLYAGLQRDGKWFNYAEIENVKGGSLAVLDGVDHSGAARLYNLIQKCVFSFFTEEGDEYTLQPMDYGDIKIADTWKIAREAIKLMRNVETLKFPEFFFCPVCSSLGAENYTEINEDWEQLIEEGYLDEIYLDSPDTTFWVELPVGIHIEPSKTLIGGTFTRIKRDILSIGDTLKLHKSAWAQKSEANMICAIWDASIIEIEHMGQREFNIFVKRNAQGSFTKTYLINQQDIDVMGEADEIHELGLNAKYRPVTCSNCHADIGGHLDWTNFFQSLLSKKLSHAKNQEVMV